VEGEAHRHNSPVAEVLSSALSALLLAERGFVVVVVVVVVARHHILP
jgi:hypothetical protein